jgi:hypothetical protein
MDEWRDNSTPAKQMVGILHEPTDKRGLDTSTFEISTYDPRDADYRVFKNVK